MKSIRTDPRNHAAEGDERIRTAVTGVGTDPVYDELHDALCGIESNCDTDTLTKEALIAVVRGRLAQAFAALAALEARGGAR